MPKWDKTRDYYVDLELSSSASTEEIKKQFKKLALKYHPDRNPGREAEVNPKFQTIQSAHEILSDETLRRQYDDARRIYSIRNPRASGVRGNPWQDIGKQYPPPPTRQTSQRSPSRPYSGAQRYTSFTANIPRTTKPSAREDPQSRKSYADAWENMRPSASRRAPPQTPGRAPTSATRDAKTASSEYVPPKTAYQQQKAQASFGNRRTGFIPRSPGQADEPPVTSKNYFTTRTHSNIFAEAQSSTTSDDPHQPPMADPLAQFREKVWDERQSMPYHSPGGEKTSLFDDVPGIGRTTSTRSLRKEDMPGAFPHSRARSSSTPRTSNNDGGSEDPGRFGKATKPSTSQQAPSGNDAFRPQFSDKSKQTAESNNVFPPPRPGTSGTAENPSTTNASKSGPNTTQTTNGPSVFTFPAGTNVHSQGAGLSRNSADSINTRFVDDELPEDWKFSAGTASASDPQTPTRVPPHSRTRVGRRHMPRSRYTDTDSIPTVQSSVGNGLGNGFSAGEWSDKIGPQNFEPQPPRSTSSSPSRRANLKKPKPVKMTAGTAGLVDEEESEGWNEANQSSTGPTQVHVDTATAMDIDSPQSDKANDTPKMSQKYGARKIPVEPHREEWRAGNVDGVRTKSTSPTRDGDPAKGGPAQTSAPETTSIPASIPASIPTSIPAAIPFAAQHGGSEDTDEFRTTFTDFKKVEPFIDPAPRGLGDFGDLKTTLPFESKPSEQIPLEKGSPPKLATLEFPAPPVAPRLPQSALSPGVRPNQVQFSRYAQDFYQYLDKWESFNARIIAHFTTRQEHYKIRRQQRGIAWLDTHPGSSDIARDYLTELEQDQVVHQQWLSAQADHQAKIREFMMFREQLK